MEIRSNLWNLFTKHLQNKWGKSTLPCLQSKSKGYTANVGIQGKKETEAKCCASRRIENVMNQKSHCVKANTVSSEKLSASEVSRRSRYCPLLLTATTALHWLLLYQSATTSYFVRQ